MHKLKTSGILIVPVLLFAGLFSSLALAGEQNPRFVTAATASKTITVKAVESTPIIYLAEGKGVSSFGIQSTGKHSGAGNGTAHAPVQIKHPPIPFEQTKQFDELYKTVSQELADYGKKATKGNFANVLKQVISERKNRAASGCVTPAMALSRLLQNEGLIVADLQRFQSFYNEQANKISQFHRPFVHLARQYMALKNEAAAAGALVPDDVWKAYKRVGGRGLFPQVLAFGGEPGHQAEIKALMDKIRRFRKSDFDIYEIWIEAEEQFRKQTGQIKGVVKAANGKLKQRMNTLSVRYKRVGEQKRVIERLFSGGLHQHCLGEIARQRGGKKAKLTDIPGMDYKLPSLSFIAANYKIFKAPGAIDPPASLHFFKDPIGESRIYAERAEANMEAAEADHYVAALDGAAHIQMLIKGYNPLNLLAPYVEHYNKSDESLWEGGANATNEIAYNMTVGFVLGTTHATGDLAEKEYNRAKNGNYGALANVKDVNALIKSYGDFTRVVVKYGFTPDFGKHPDRPGANASSDDWTAYTNKVNDHITDVEKDTKKIEENNKRVKEAADILNDKAQIVMAVLAAKSLLGGAGTFARGELPSIPGAALLEDLRNFGKNAGKTLEVAKHAARISREAAKKGIKITGEAAKQAARITREAAIKVARITGEAAKNGIKITGEAARNIARITREAAIKAARITGDAAKQAARITRDAAKQAASITGNVAKNTTLKLVEQYDKWKENAKNNRDILDHPENYPKDIVEIAKNNSTVEEIAKNTNNQLKIIRDAEQQAAHTLIDKEQQSSLRTEELSNPTELTDKNGNKIIRGSHNLGSGSFKITYESGKKNEVVQLYKEGNEATFTAHRENVGADRARHAGVYVAKGKAVQLTDGNWVKVAERVNSDNIVENMVKDGRMTPEMKAAMIKTLQQLNDDGIIWTDPNPGNWYRKVNKNGTVEAAILDPDGMVSVRDLIAEGKSKINIGEEEFDLTNKSDVSKLQERLAIGRKSTFGLDPTSPLGRGYGKEFGDNLSTRDYSMSSGEFVPSSYGSLSDVLGKDFHQAHESFTQPGAGLETTLLEGRKNRLETQLRDNEAYNGANNNLKTIAENERKTQQAIDEEHAREQKRKRPPPSSGHHASSGSPEGDQPSSKPAAPDDLLDINSFLDDSSGLPSMDMPDMPDMPDMSTGDTPTDRPPPEDFDFSEGDLDALFGGQ